MLDYAEGIIMVKQVHRDMYGLILSQKFGEAAEKANELESIAKILKQKLEQEAKKIDELNSVSEIIEVMRENKSEKLA